MNFASAMKNEMTHTYTENGAKARNTSGDSCLDFFSVVGSLRDTNNDRKIRLFENAYNEDSLIALRTLFYARDIRGGLGERDTFRVILKHIANISPKNIINNIDKIPFYGRWDDLYSLIGTKCEDDMWAFMKKSFQEDWIKYCANKPISLLAKWIHNGNESSPRSRQLGIRTAHKLGYSVYDFKRMIVKLRKHIDVVEAKMSTNRWDEINYSTVPSRASMIYRNAFIRHDGDRYSGFIDDVNSGKEKINTSTLYPYDILHKVRHNIADDTLETLWKNLPNYVEGNPNVIVVADTSGSMECSNGRPMDVALSLAIYFAQRNVGAYHNMWMTFSNQPRFQQLKGVSLKGILRNMDTTGWSMNTNLEAAFNLILNTAIENNISKDEIPASIVVISDMEIDCCEHSGWSFYDAMRDRYKNHGYTIPNVVFWNVNSRHDVYHADSKRKGVQLVSGQAASTFNTLMKSIGMTPVEYMNYVVNSERYLPIKLYI